MLRIQSWIEAYMGSDPGAEQGDDAEDADFHMGGLF